MCGLSKMRIAAQAPLLTVFLFVGGCCCPGDSPAPSAPLPFEQPQPYGPHGWTDSVPSREAGPAEPRSILPRRDERPAQPLLPDDPLPMPSQSR